jgi:integrase
VALLETKHVNGILDALADKPGAARNTRKRLQQIMQFAVERGWRPDNPVLAVKRRRTKTEGFIPWSEADIDVFMGRWPAGSRERLAMALLLYTGQRRSDVVGMGRQHVKGGRISVKQVKTDARLRIPLHPRLQAELDLLPAGQLTFLQTAHGVAFTAAGFGNYFGDAAREAGLVKRSAHGLRKAAGRRLAEAGCTAKQIAAVLGHSTLAQVEVYTRDADQQRLADAAFVQLSEAGT